MERKKMRKLLVTMTMFAAVSIADLNAMQTQTSYDNSSAPSGQISSAIPATDEKAIVAEFKRSLYELSEDVIYQFSCPKERRNAEWDESKLLPHYFGPTEHCREFLRYYIGKTIYPEQKKQLSQLTNESFAAFMNAAIDCCEKISEAFPGRPQIAGEFPARLIATQYKEDFVSLRSVCQYADFTSARCAHKENIAPSDRLLASTLDAWNYVLSLIYLVEGREKQAQLVREQNADIIEVLFKHKQPDANYSTNLNSVLHIASHQRRDMTVEFIVKFGKAKAIQLFSLPTDTFQSYYVDMIDYYSTRCVPPFVYIDSIENMDAFLKIHSSHCVAGNIGYLFYQLYNIAGYRREQNPNTRIANNEIAMDILNDLFSFDQEWHFGDLSENAHRDLMWNVAESILKVTDYQRIAPYLYLLFNENKEIQKVRLKNFPLVYELLQKPTVCLGMVQSIIDNGHLYTPFNYKQFELLH